MFYKNNKYINNKHHTTLLKLKKCPLLKLLFSKKLFLKPTQYISQRGQILVIFICRLPICSTYLDHKIIKKLTDVIGVSVVHWKLDKKTGWKLLNAGETKLGENAFKIDGGILSSQDDTSSPLGDLDESSNRLFKDGTFDPHYGVTQIKELYDMTDKQYKGEYFWPILWDLKTKTIVNNNWDQIDAILNSAFNDFDETKGTVDIFPETLSSQIEKYNEWLFPHIIDGVYNVGLAEKQSVYETNLINFFKDMDKIENKLREVHDTLAKEYGASNEEEILKRFFLFGGQITESDIRLFVTMIRFDSIYAVHFKLNYRLVRSDYYYIHLWMRNLYWNYPAFGHTTDFNHIKLLYTHGMRNINPNGIVPLGPEYDILKL
ncbi:uncharacterized protein NDAI_0B01870 [Naumovozyma dairenensis CBS 421]|uniref:GST C-terminal domain-containing protein n=1 Tax=Naumovozyma dairenensis (strain ATCC 10597 / BCRC 20456 / CBS 421 / NBRC 0211 / NRRL Y-12639) TaxID=1071378 RepID=G0W610_NAUDC|nr:hypothetical protein NDAI_0B01870 [Naumovozyma dairenensis CBS 421]CCD23221.1 hypothetical protein NDAI_0B01870 [Naumovozyma dairenensis CBS 421]